LDKYDFGGLLFLTTTNNNILQPRKPSNLRRPSTEHIFSFPQIIKIHNSQSLTAANRKDEYQQETRSCQAMGWGEDGPGVQD
jgi:hypothetical protein